MSAPHPPCDECHGTGWMLYRSETVDGEHEEAYRLCPNRCTPRSCMSRFNDGPCPRPGTVHYELGYFCKEHIEVIRADEDAKPSPRGDVLSQVVIANGPP